MSTETDDTEPTGEAMTDAARLLGGSRSVNKTAANPRVAARLKVAQAANRKPLEEIACCGREPHLKSCLRWRAMRRRAIQK